MPRPTRTWKSRERQIARDFGGERQRLSGSSGRPGDSCSDSTHEKLYIEAKHSKKPWAAANLYRDTAKKAKAEGKIPMVALTEHGRPGYLLVVHSSDLLAIARMRESALAEKLARDLPPEVDG
jgi:hypothetical protein